MDYLYIRNWEKWQSYRKDRSTPPWIKVHRNIFSNHKWALLSDSDKGQLVSIWILSADNNGRVPDNAKMIQKMCQLDSEPDLNKFKDLNLLSSVDANLTPNRQPSDAPDQTRPEPDKSREEPDQTIMDDKLNNLKEGFFNKNNSGLGLGYDITLHLGWGATQDAEYICKAYGKNLQDMIQKYNADFIGGIQNGKPPDKPDKAFIGWLKNYLKKAA